MGNKRADNAPRQETKGYDPNKVTIIGIDTPADPSHWGYDQESNDTDLLEADILFTYANGIIQAPLARRDGDSIIIVAGRGRTRLLREANKRRVSDGLTPWLLYVQIVKGDHKKMVLYKIGENSHRRDQGPLARTRQAEELSRQYPEEEAATIMGLGLKQFKTILKRLDWAPQVQKAVQQGNLLPSAADGLSGLSQADQTARLTEVMANASASGHKPTARDVKAKVAEANGKTPTETPATRIKKVSGILEKLPEDATKDDLWAAIRRIKAAVKPATGRASQA